MSTETDRDAAATVIMNAAALSVVEAEWVADAILGSEWLAEHDARVAAEARKSALEQAERRINESARRTFTREEQEHLWKAARIVRHLRGGEGQ